MDHHQSVDAAFQLLPQVVLSPEGTFKYILIHARLTHNNKLLEFVRGDISLAYHMDNFNKFRKEFKAASLRLDGELLQEGVNVELSCPGGGRVVHSASKKTLSIYGYSQSYGQANHSHVADIVRRVLGYEDIRVSFEGY